MKKNLIRKSNTADDLTTINQHIIDMASQSGENVTIKNDVLKFINKGKSERKYGQTKIVSYVVKH